MEHAPVDWEWGKDLANGLNARLHVRTRLHMARWPGDVERAAQLAGQLVDAAPGRMPDGRIVPGIRIWLRLAVTTAAELLISATYPVPARARTDTRATAETVRMLGARWSRTVAEDGATETVQALMTTQDPP